MNYGIYIMGLFFLFACSEKKQNPDDSSAAPNDKILYKNSTFYFMGDTIKTLIAGELEWMAENLNVKTSDSWCYEDQEKNCEKEGRLYRWESARETCTILGENWRLPTEEEWTTLLTYSGGYFDYLTEKSIGRPKDSNERLGPGGKSGFNANRNGWRGSNGGYSDRGTVGFYWSASELDDVEAWFFIFYPKGGKSTKRAIKKRMGMSCRCVRFKT